MALLAGWWRQLLDADRATGRNLMDIEDENLLRVVDGTPALLGASHLPLSVAAATYGIGVDELLRQAAVGGMQLYVPHVGAPGHMLPYHDLPVGDGELGTRIVPSPAETPQSAPPLLLRGDRRQRR